MTDVNRDTWIGAVNRTSSRPPLRLEFSLEQSANGSSGTFRGRCDDGQQWWIKPLNQLQGGKTIVNDQVLARVGQLIGAPVCSVALIEITEDTIGYEFRQGQFTQPGISHGSLHIGDPLAEDRILRDRGRDENAIRHAGMYALWDWCFGHDDQWLYSANEDNRAYAHDLGHFLPGMNSWTGDMLIAAVDQPHMPTWPAGGLDPGELDRLAQALDSIDQTMLLAALDGVPSAWPVTTEDLETLGWFLESRASEVAARLRVL